MDKIKKYTTGFAQISNIVLTDPNLSLKAKGLYSYLFSKPDGWIFYRDKILAENKDSKASYQTGINELINAGYIKRHQLKVKNGKFGGAVYEFIDPNKILSTKTPQTENQSAAPQTEKPQTENQPYNNIYINNNKYNILNNKYINTTIKEKINKKEKLEKSHLSTGLSPKLSTSGGSDEILITTDFKIDTTDILFSNLNMLGKGVLSATEQQIKNRHLNEVVNKMLIVRTAAEIYGKGKRGKNGRN